MAAVPPVEAQLLAAVLGAEEDDITSFSYWLQDSTVGAHSPAWFPLASQTRPAAYAAHLSATIRDDVNHFHHSPEAGTKPRRVVPAKIGSLLRVTPESFPALTARVRQKPASPASTRGRAPLCPRLTRLSILWAHLLEHSLLPSLLAEIQFIFQTLTLPIVEALRPEAHLLQSSGEAAAVAGAVLKLSAAVVQSLGPGVVASLLACPAVSEYASALLVPLQTSLAATNSSPLQAHSPATVPLPLPFQPSRDSRHLYRDVEAQRQYNNREVCRDILYSTLRRAGGGDAVALHSGARELVQRLRLDNYAWLSEVLVAQVLEVGGGGEVDEQVVCLTASHAHLDPLIHLQRLHHRLTTSDSTPASGSALLPSSLRLHASLLEEADSQRLCRAVVSEVRGRMRLLSEEAALPLSERVLGLRACALLLGFLQPPPPHCGWEWVGIPWEGSPLLHLPWRLPLLRLLLHSSPLLHSPLDLPMVRSVLSLYRLPALRPAHKHFGFGSVCILSQLDEFCSWLGIPLPSPGPSEGGQGPDPIAALLDGLYVQHCCPGLRDLKVALSPLRVRPSPARAAPLRKIVPTPATRGSTSAAVPVRAALERLLLDSRPDLRRLSHFVAQAVTAIVEEKGGGVRLAACHAAYAVAALAPSHDSVCVKGVVAAMTAAAAARNLNTAPPLSGPLPPDTRVQKKAREGGEEGGCRGLWRGLSRSCTAATSCCVPPPLPDVHRLALRLHLASMCVGLEGLLTLLPGGVPPGGLDQEVASGGVEIEVRAVVEGGLIRRTLALATRLALMDPPNAPFSCVATWHALMNCGILQPTLFWLELLCTARWRRAVEARQRKGEGGGHEVSAWLCAVLEGGVVPDLCMKQRWREVEGAARSAGGELGEMVDQVGQQLPPWAQG